jgi:hypothetical protein
MTSQGAGYDRDTRGKGRPTVLRASASPTASDAVKVSGNDGWCRFADITCRNEASASRSYLPTRKVYSA